MNVDKTNSGTSNPGGQGSSNSGAQGASSSGAQGASSSGASYTGPSNPVPSNPGTSNSGTPTTNELWRKRELEEEGDYDGYTIKTYKKIRADGDMRPHIIEKNIVTKEAPPKKDFKPFEDHIKQVNEENSFFPDKNEQVRLEERAKLKAKLVHEIKGIPGFKGYSYSHVLEFLRKSVQLWECNNFDRIKSPCFRDLEYKSSGKNISPESLPLIEQAFNRVRIELKEEKINGSTTIKRVIELSEKRNKSSNPEKQGFNVKPSNSGTNSIGTQKSSSTDTGGIQGSSNTYTSSIDTEKPSKKPKKILPQVKFTWQKA